MNLTLHWLRRDLRRHALLILLWALLVALFTGARVWFRTHPEVSIGDRDLWLSLPAAGLGLAEVCLLLRVLMDDPARGAQAFWKTRPPSGGGVFAAKGVIIALVALVIPLTAEGVFLQTVGLSSGGAERFTLYLLPPMLALLAGVAAQNWRMVTAWLPLAMLAPGAAFFYWVWATMDQTRVPADHRLCMALALLAAAMGAAWLYRCRVAGRALAALLLVLPGVVASGVSATGWLGDPRLTTPPPGKSADGISLSLAQAPRVSRDYEDRGWGLNFSLKTESIGAEDFAVGALGRVRIAPEGQPEVTLPVMESDRQFRSYMSGGMATFWNVRCDESLARILQTTPTTLSGTLLIRCYDQKRQSLLIKGTQTAETGTGRWHLTPETNPSPEVRARHGFGMNYGGPYLHVEFIRTETLGLHDWAVQMQPAAVLRRTSDGLEMPVQNFHITRWPYLWEGAVSFWLPLQFSIPSAERRTDDEIREELRDPAQQENWRLEFDTLSFTGTLEVPFSLSFSLPPPQP